jgi:hypothetical protein
MIAALILHSWLILANPPSDLQYVRNMYLQAPADKSAAEGLLLLLNRKTTPSTTIQGYKGAATIIMAQHTFNPYSKFRYFNNGKFLLEQAISRDNNNPELRYLRLTIQSQAPAFLGYTDNLNNDRQFLLERLPSLTDTQLKTLIVSFLKQTPHARS